MHNIILFSQVSTWDQFDGLNMLRNLLYLVPVLLSESNTQTAEKTFDECAAPWRIEALATVECTITLEEEDAKKYSWDKDNL